MPRNQVGQMPWLGAHRNSVIVNAILGREAYTVRERNVFQSFGSAA